MTSFYMTSLHVDLNEAAKCVDIIPFMKVQGLKTWKEFTTGDQQLVRLFF